MEGTATSSTAQCSSDALALVTIIRPTTAAGDDEERERENLLEEGNRQLRHDLNRGTLHKNWEPGVMNFWGPRIAMHHELSQLHVNSVITDHGWQHPEHRDTPPFDTDIQRHFLIIINTALLLPVCR
jgi:hypothetical protein